MINNNIKNDSGLLALAIRLVIGWTYFSAFWRRTVLADKLDPEVAGYIGEKFNHFLPNALGIKPLIQYLVENPDILWLNMVIFTIIEGIVGLFIIFGLFTRIMSIGVFGLAMGILLGSGWLAINRTTKFPNVMSVIFSMGLEVWFGESVMLPTLTHECIKIRFERHVLIILFLFV